MWSRKSARGSSVEAQVSSPKPKQTIVREGLADPTQHPPGRGVEWPRSSCPLGQILALLSGRLRALRMFSEALEPGIAALAGVERLERHGEAREPRVGIDALHRERHSFQWVTRRLRCSYGIRTES